MFPDTVKRGSVYDVDSDIVRLDGRRIRLARERVLLRLEERVALDMLVMDWWVDGVAWVVGSGE